VLNATIARALALNPVPAGSAQPVRMAVAETTPEGREERLR